MIVFDFNNLSKSSKKSFDINWIKISGPMAFLLLEDMDIHMACQRRARSKSVSTNGLGVVTCESM